MRITKNRLDKLLQKQFNELTRNDLQIVCIAVMHWLSVTHKNELSLKKIVEISKEYLLTN